MYQPCSRTDRFLNFFLHAWIPLIPLLPSTWRTKHCLLASKVMRGPRALLGKFDYLKWNRQWYARDFQVSTLFHANLLITKRIYLNWMYLCSLVNHKVQGVWIVLNVLVSNSFLLLEKKIILTLYYNERRLVEPRPETANETNHICTYVRTHTHTRAHTVLVFLQFFEIN